MDAVSPVPAPALTHISILGKKPAHSGKVRDVYDLGDELLVVATDRISAFDCIFPNGIPGKGRILSKLSLFWFERLGHIVPHHFLGSPDLEWLLDFANGDRAAAKVLLRRSMRVRKCRPLPVECIVRGSLEGSGWKEYQQAGKIQEHQLPAGLNLHDRLPEPIFTPSTKAAEGHDENITFAQMAESVGAELAGRVRAASIQLFTEARGMLAEKGITLADTKFEFGLDEAGELRLIDEVLTPDSSRFLVVGDDGEIVSMDKQFVRNWAETADWDKTPPAPGIPAEVIAQTAARYAEVAHMISGA